MVLPSVRLFLQPVARYYKRQKEKLLFLTQKKQKQRSITGNAIIPNILSRLLVKELHWLALCSLSIWSLHVLFVSVWLLSSFSGFRSQSKDVYVGPTGNIELTVGVRMRVNGCLSFYVDL